MPTERIFGLPEYCDYLAKVNWQADRDVRLSVELHSTDPATGLFTHLLQGHAEDIGSVIKAWNSSDATHHLATMTDREVGEQMIALVEAGRAYREVGTMLDRAQCNRLISVLRRARNSAYGADE